MSARILGYARTPYCKINGQLSHFTAVQLGAHAVKAALSRAGISPAEVQQLVAGQVLQAAAGQNPARQTAVAAGIPNHVPSITLNSVCLSGAEAITYGVALIELGQADVVVAVGQESMTHSPHAMVGSRAGKKYGSIHMVDTLELDGLTDAFSGESMGLATDKVTAAAGISRLAQDEYSVLSHQRAAENRERLNREIDPMILKTRHGEQSVGIDDGIREDISLESVQKLRPAFMDDGTITAANASQLTDGAAAVVLVSEKYAQEHNLGGLAKVRGYAKVAGPDYSLNLQPANAIKAAAVKAAVDVSELEQLEINEAFAAVVLASAADLGVGLERVNRLGGGIALGHPIGSSGARITGSLALSLHIAGAGTLGAIGICGGGGQGVGIVLEGI